MAFNPNKIKRYIIFKTIFGDYIFIKKVISYENGIKETKKLNKDRIKWTGSRYLFVSKEQYDKLKNKSIF